jgi:hypothetical protein
MPLPVLPLPMEVWPYIRAPRAAGLAGEARLDVGKPSIIRHRSPLIAVQWEH